jgi:hypothetical protein
MELSDLDVAYIDIFAGMVYFTFYIYLEIKKYMYFGILCFFLAMYQFIQIYYLV